MTDPIEVFVTYSKHDARYLKDDSLLGFLRGLEREGVRFWTDREIPQGALWDADIQQHLAAAPIALVLVSQWFLDTVYAQDVEIPALLTNKAHLLPVILSPCEWRRHEWLSSRQFLPTDDQTIEEHYAQRGKRERLFLEIRRQLWERVEEVRREAASADFGADPAADRVAWYQRRIRRWSGPRYELDRRFVRLNLLLDQGEEAEGQRWQPRETDLRSVAEVLDEVPDPAVVLLGEPGCGKSTLLRHHELDQARAVLASSQDPTQAALTFFVSLSTYRPTQPQDPLPEAGAWLEAEWATENPELPPLADLQRAGRVTLLLDALNEVPAPQAEVVARWKDYLAALHRTCPEARVVFSCRGLDYSASLSTKELPVPQVRIKPLGDGQVGEFLERYAPDHAARLLAQLRDSGHLDLFRSAYYLKLLVDLAADGQVPEGRSALFTAVLRGLLEREMVAVNPLFGEGGLLEPRDRMQLSQHRWAGPWSLPERGPLVGRLSALAHAMQADRRGQESGQLRVGYDQALDLLDHPSLGDRISPGDLIRAGEDLGVIDEDLARDELFYVHQLMQEWFAARHLAREGEGEGEDGLERLAVPWRADEVSPSLKETLADLADSDPLPPLATTGWEETARLAAAMAADPGAFVAAVAELNLPLAGRCAAQADVVMDAAQRDGLRQALLQRTQDPAADLRARIAAARALGELGDPRLESGTGADGDDYLLPPLVAIPSGRYTLGSDDGHYDNETPVHTVELAGFRIATLAVTNAEWALFIAAGGYDDERWWTSAEDQAWRRGEGTSEGPKQQLRDNRRLFQEQSGLLTDWFDEGRITSLVAEKWQGYVGMSDEEFEALLDKEYPEGRQTTPAYWGDANYNHRSQPVVGICWHEARAYCAWLAHQCGQAVRLPSEAEWEAAARGSEARRYPYGDEFDAGCGNTFETHVRGTTPVGVFPEGGTPDGLLDISGNTWDWTSTLHQPYPYEAEDGREDELSGSGRRVVRGGSWNRRPSLRARCLP